MARLVTGALQAHSLEEAGREILAGARAFTDAGLSDDACLILAGRQ
jgi:hypothetical protein